MLRFIAFAGAVLGMVAATSPVVASSLNYGDGPTLVWVKVAARPGEQLWQACRRLYQRDVYQVRRGRDGYVWCHIEHYRMYDHDRRRRNYNLD